MPPVRVRIWDLPTRLFHLALVGTITGALLTAHWHDGDLTWHMRFGLAALCLVLFRLGWGVFGTRYARFAAMLRSPRVILQYARGQLSQAGRPWAGHNPLGALSVVAMLAAVLVQALTGLLANDDIAFEGPWARHVDKAWSDWFTWLHADVNSTLIYALIALHLLALLYYRIKKRLNLIPPMLTGDVIWPARSTPPPAAQDTLARRVVALVYFVCCMAVVITLTQF